MVNWVNLMKINDLEYLAQIETLTKIIGGDFPGFYGLNNWGSWLSSDGNSASAFFSAIAMGDNTYTNVEATLIVTENSSYSSVSSVAISSSS